MKVVIAMDSFKGSLSSMDAGQAAARGIKRVFPDAGVIVKPLADGGEGTTEALTKGLGGSLVETRVTGPLGKKTTARYGILQDGHTAVMEMAEAAGIVLLKSGELDPWNATTYGVGEMILDAADRGCRDFIIGIGGSATTDAGTGMLRALGYEFLDEGEKPIGNGCRDLGKIAAIRSDRVSPILRDCRFQIACDVKNPLCGENGAAYVFGPQKGVRPEEREEFDSRIRHFAKMTAVFTGADHSLEEGAGAAGGLGFAFLSYLPHVLLRPGIKTVLGAVRLEEELAGTDLVLTGEGRLDGQTAMGKAPLGVARLAKKYGCRVVAFAGGVTEDAGKCNKEGIDAFFPIVRGAVSLQEAMDPLQAEKNMEASVEQVFRLLRSCIIKNKEKR